MLRSTVWLAAVIVIAACAVVVPVDVQAEKKAEGQDGATGWSEVHNGEPSNERDAKRKKIKVVFKEKKNQGLRIKITKIKYHKDPPPAAPATNPVTVTLTSTPAGQANEADLPTDIDWDEKVEIETTLYDDTATVQTPVGRAEYDFQWLDVNGDACVGIEVGGDTVVSIPGGEDPPLTVLDVAEDLLELSASDFETPDLIMWSREPINDGEILFCPVGQFRFTSVVDVDNVLVFDKNGNSLRDTVVTIDAIELTARGDLKLTIVVDGTSPPLAIMVRGVEVTMDVGADTNSKHGYTVGGDAVHHLESEVCLIANGTTLLNNWQVQSWTPAYNWGYATADIDGEEDPIVIGATTATVGGEDNSGYREAIVIEAAAAGNIKNGKLILRCLSGAIFDLDGEEKLYIVNATNDNDAFHEDLVATITGNAYGDLIVNLTNIESYLNSTRVKLILTGIRVSYTAPVAYGTAYDMVTFGPALRAPLKVATPLIEGAEELDPPAGGLPESPLDITGWTPIGS
jgi:hypothetical protein